MARTAVRRLLATASALAAAASLAAPASAATEKPKVSQVTLSPNRVDAGAPPVTGTVTLDIAATTDVTVQLRSGNTQAATVPATVAVRKGQTQATFTVTIGKPAATVSTSITAMCGVLRAANLVVQVAPVMKVQSVNLYPSTIAAGGKVIVVVKLSTTAPTGGQAVTLTYSPAGIVTGPASVKVPERAAAAEVTVTAGSPARQTAAVIKAAIGQTSFPATLTIKGTAPVTPRSAFVTPGRLAPGDNGTLFVDLSDPAPLGGLTLTLSSNAPDSLILPATATVAAGETRKSVSVSAKAGAKGGTAHITVAANGTSVRADVDITRPK